MLILKLTPKTFILKKLLLVTVFLLGYTQAFLAQDLNVDIKTSEVYKDKKKNTTLSFTASDGKGGLFVGRSYYGGLLKTLKGYYIEHYDSNLNLVKEFDYEIDRETVQQAFVNNGELHLLTTQYDRDSREIKCLVQSTSVNNFKFSSKELMSLNIKESSGRFVGFYGIGLQQVDGDSFGSISLSKNNNYIVVNFDIKNKDEETHKIHVFNKNFEEVFTNTFKRDIKDRKFTLKDISVDDNNGTVYLLGKAYTDQKRKKKEGGKYQYELYRINAKSSKSLSFDTDDKFVRSLTPVFDNDRVFCVGFYSEKNDNRFKGVGYFNIDPETLTITSKKFSPFTEQFIMDKYGKSKDKELRNISYRDILITSDGECLINGEEFYVTSHYVSNQYGGTWRYTYHYRDIVSLKLGKEGNLIWARNINKKQASSAPSDYLSFTSTYHNDKAYIFINCSDKVRKLRNDRLEFKGIKAKKSNLYVITIDSEGTYDYKSLIDDKDAEVPFRVGNGIYDFSNEIIFLGQRGRKKQLLKLTL